MKGTTRLAGRALLATLVLPAAVVAAQPRLLDGFDSASGWSVITSEGVMARLSEVAGRDGGALRVDFDFAGGGGYCVIRRTVSLDLPDNYRFGLAVRGQAPPNNLEFKLIDTEHDNVWWFVRRNFHFPADWRNLLQKKRQIRFAWGPASDAPLRRIEAIELAISAGEGGKGYVVFDDLTFEPLPEPQPVTHTPTLRFSSTRDGGPLRATVGDDGRVSWHSAAGDRTPRITADFRQYRELGGLRLDWDEHDYAVDYDVALSADGETWQGVRRVRGAAGGLRYVQLPDAEGRYVRIDVRKTSRGRGVGLCGFYVLGASLGDSPNRMFARIARDAPRGWYPRYFVPEQQPWTVVGVPEDSAEALIDAAGAVEVGRGAFRIEPMLRVGGRLVTWADVSIEQSLAGGYLPIPTVTWRSGGLSLAVTALAIGPAGRSTLVVGYALRNESTDRRAATLFLAIRPFQVLPPWQNLNLTGGATRIERISRRGATARVDGRRVTSWTTPNEFGATTFARGEIVEYIAAGRLPPAASVSDPDGFASAAWRYDFDLPPGQTRRVVLSVPLHETDTAAPAAALSPTAAGMRFDDLLARSRASWSREIDRVTLALPDTPGARRLADTFRTMQAYILINADGPAIQPGSRTYERSWIRDGAMTSTALLYTGHARRVRAFAEWYAKYQYPSGKVPAVVDRRGADPVDEHDSTGEFIHLLLRTYQFTHDAAFLRAHLPQVVAGVDYLESLRARRLGPEYRDGPPPRRACYGLVPDSISHEGYSAKPMHSYWDDFWVLRGLKDATTIALVCARPDLRDRFARLRDAFRRDLYASISLAMKLHKIDYIPGCVELGDFDATSTAIAVFPGGELGRAPEPALRNTFERYWDFFRRRRDGKLEWDNYTPYEIRLAGTFIRLGQPERAQALLRFFFDGQRPPAWNQWAEVVWRKPQTPRFIGDMPHTWVGSAYINAVRSMFVYEDERHDALVLAAGVPQAWLAEPGARVRIGGFPTMWGTVSYTLERRDGRCVLRLTGTALNPPGGIITAGDVTLRMPPEQ